MVKNLPALGFNTWNTFGENINEQLVRDTADAMAATGLRDAGYTYLVIDDCWSKRERDPQTGKIVPDEEKFPNGMKAVSDYVHSKGLKFGMYSCAGTMTCAGYPSSYGYEFEDAKQFAEWGVDYLKYDFCNFPQCANCENAYLTMAMALKNCGRDIVFAACNWGVDEPAKWMRSHGAHTYRSTGDIFDNRKSFTDIFEAQVTNVESNAPGCYNDMDMLIVGMHGSGTVGLGGCTSEEYMLHFALWAFLGSPLIVGSDIRSLPEEDKKTLLCKGLIDINQDSECRPPFVISNVDSRYVLMKILSGGRFALMLANAAEEENGWKDTMIISFDDCGIHSNTSHRIKFTNAVTGEDVGIFKDFYRTEIKPGRCQVLVGELC